MTGFLRTRRPLRASREPGAVVGLTGTTVRRPWGRGALLAVLALGGLNDAALARPRRPPPGPVVVELFTAQGCATCPEGNRVVAELEGDADVLPLTFSVDYWDYLGWRDTLAEPAFTDRQRAYVERLKVREIYTPEIVVEGSAEGPALEQAKIEGLIGDAEEHRGSGARLRFFRHGQRVQVEGRSPEARADVWLIRYDPEPVSVKVKAGENKGQVVTVRNAVRELTRLGGWKGGSKTFIVPAAANAALKTAVVVQEPKGGPILGAVRN